MGFERFPAGTTRYQYDSLGNLRSVTLPNGNTITYLIDPQNRRIGKQKNGSLEYGLIYQDQLRPIAQTQLNGTIRSIFLYGETHAPEGMLRDGKVYRLIGDHLGSVRMVIDADTGDVAQRMDYDAWGKITYDSNPGFQPFGYAGGIYDPDTGLTRFGARDYDAEVGRWTAKDPILFEGGDTNLYGYVLQDPINWIDPDGRARFGGRGKGERGRTARPDGTGNPYKHTRPDPTDPTKILQKDADGKWIKKAKPEGYDEAIKRKQKGEVLPELLEWFLLPWVLTPSELGCSTMDCHYTWDECEKPGLKMSDLYFKKAQDAESNGRYKKAFSIYLRGIRSGEFGCELNLGYCYDNGIGVRKNKKKAAFHYKKCSDRGEFSGAANLALVYRKHGKERLAERYLQIALDLGDSDAALDLAKISLKKGDVEKAGKYLDIVVGSRRDEVTPSARDEAVDMLRLFSTIS